MLELRNALDRCDAAGRAFAGSQRQIQFYVNERPDALDRAISEAFARPFSPRWVSPLRDERYEEYRDERFLKALKLGHFLPRLKAFWPTGGPRWDALARVEGDPPGVILLEAKSHVEEICGCCKAKDPVSLVKIDAALAQAKRWLQVPPGTDWKGDFYQMANRCAHLYFFREVLGIEAWLVNLCFVDDPHSPTTRGEWENGLAGIKREFGAAEIPFCANVFLPAADR